MQKSEPVGDSGGGKIVDDGLIDLVNAKTGMMHLEDDDSRKLACKENDLHDDADGEADDDEER